MTARPPQVKPAAPAGPAVSDVWTTRRLLKWMTDHFTAKQVESPRVVAEMLLAHVLGCERMRLYMDVDRPASAAELSQLRDLIARAAKHEPVQYLVGEAWFFGRAFHVNRSTLIPRPCTETLVEHVLQWHRLNPGHVNPLFADIGTGTGCMAISLAAQIPSSRVIATDVIPEALELAKHNAMRYKMSDRIEFRLGAGVSPMMLRPDHGQSSIAAVPGERFDAICSNPPYISDAEWNSATEVGRNVKGQEPESALRGGPDGLHIIRTLIADAPALLKPGGLLAIEIGVAHRDAVLQLAAANPLLENAVVLKDHEGLWRVLVTNRK